MPVCVCVNEIFERKKKDGWCKDAKKRGDHGSPCARMRDCSEMELRRLIIEML